MPRRWAVTQSPLSRAILSKPDIRLRARHETTSSEHDSSALRLFSWEQPENALSKIQSAGQSIGRVQFGGREFSREHLSRLFAILERNKQRFWIPTSFLFPGVMLRDDASFDLVFDFLRMWKELYNVQFERGSSLSRAAVNKCLRLPSKKTLSL